MKSGDRCRLIRHSSFNELVCGGPWAVGGWQPLLLILLMLLLCANVGVRAQTAELTEKVERLRRGESLEVGSYAVGATRDLPAGLADDLPLDSAPDGSNLLATGTRDFPAGTWLVRADQARMRLLFTLIEPWSQDAPLGLESVNGEHAGVRDMYPVHRIAAGASLGSLRTEPAELGSTRADSGH